MWQEGDSHGYASDTICGLSRFYPGARAAIPTARQYLHNWGSVLHRKRAFPLPRAILGAMVGAAMSYDRLDLAALLLAGFLGLLRTAEIVGLKAGQLHFSPDGRKVLIMLYDTKTAKRKGGNVEHVIIHDAVAIKALQAASAG
eukprot:803485-Pyramimonas_sp.AAC.1